MISAAITRKKAIDTSLFLASWKVKKTSPVTQDLDVSAEVNKKIPTPISPPIDQIQKTNFQTRAENLIAKRIENIKALDDLLKGTFNV